MPVSEERLAESRKLLAEIRANFATLASCVGPHEWLKEDGMPKMFSKRKCAKCGGEMDAVHARYYDEGVAHGRAAQKDGTR